MMWCAVFYYVIGTHEPLPAFTTEAMSCQDAKSVAEISGGPGVYAVVRTVGPRMSEPKN